MFTEEVISDFNDLEVIVFNYILKNKEKIPYMTIRELSKEAHVSTTTIIRFCKKLSCNGFSEFKVKFKLSLNRENSVKLKDDKTVFMDFLNRSDSERFQDNLNIATNMIKEAKNIIFIGIGNSGVMARYGARYFSSIGKFSLYVDDPYYPVIPCDSQNTLAIVLSVTGESNIMIRNIIKLKEEETKIISITNTKNSTISKISDLNISYYVQFEEDRKNQTLDFVDLTSQLPVVYIIESLAKRVHNLKNQP